MVGGTVDVVLVVDVDVVVVDVVVVDVVVVVAGTVVDVDVVVVVGVTAPRPSRTNTAAIRPMMASATAELMSVVRFT